MKGYKNIEELNKKINPLNFKTKKNRVFYLMSGEEMTGNEGTCLIFEKGKKEVKENTANPCEYSDKEMEIFSSMDLIAHNIIKEKEKAVIYTSHKDLTQDEVFFSAINQLLEGKNIELEFKYLSKEEIKKEIFLTNSFSQ